MRLTRRGLLSLIPAVGLLSRLGPVNWKLFVSQPDYALKLVGRPRMTETEIVAAELERVYNSGAIEKMFERDDAFFAQISRS